MRLVVMGVAGSGKTTVGTMLAERLGAAYVEGDSAHSAENVAKMSAGIPLTDEDRWPWLVRLRSSLQGSDDVVVTCSALKGRYRDVLRHAGDVRFLFLDLDEKVAHERAALRIDHFMGAGMVAGQFAALERPTQDETDVLTLDASATPESIVAAALDALPTVSPMAPPADLPAPARRDL